MTVRQAENMFYTLLNNKWMGSSSGETVPIYSPDDNEIVGEVPSLSQEEVGTAIQQTADMQEIWEAKEGHERSELLHRWAEELKR